MKSNYNSRVLISFEDKPDIAPRSFSELYPEELIRIRKEIDLLLERSNEADKDIDSNSSLLSKIHDAQIRTSEEPAASEKAKEPLYLFEDDHSEMRPGKPGEEKSHYCNWFEFYTIDEKNKSRHENQIYEISERPLSAKNIKRRKDRIYNEFRKKHPGHPVIVLKMEPLEGMSARVRMDEALKKYKKDFNALKELPAYEEPKKAKAQGR